MKDITFYVEQKETGRNVLARFVEFPIQQTSTDSFFLAVTNSSGGQPVLAVVSMRSLKYCKHLSESDARKIRPELLEYLNRILPIVQSSNDIKEVFRKASLLEKERYNNVTVEQADKLLERLGF